MKQKTTPLILSPLNVHRYLDSQLPNQQDIPLSTFLYLLMYLVLLCVFVSLYCH